MLTMFAAQVQRQPRAAARARERERALGFTLIELIVTLVLLGILIAIGLPAFKNMVGNAQVRTVAEALQNGLRLARTEALRSNSSTVFALTNATPASGVTAALGNNWFVQTAPSTGNSPEYIQGGALGDVAGGVGIASAPVGLCFNSNGRLSQPAATAVVLPSGMAACPSPANTSYTVYKTGMSDRSLVVQVTIGGQVRLCDPQRTRSPTAAASTGPDGC